VATGDSTTIADSLIAQLRRRLPPGPGGRVLGGVCAAARPLLVAALAEEAGDGLTVVVPTARDADELAAGLALFAPRLEAVVVPAEAFESYLGTSPSLGATAAAAAALRAVVAGPSRVLVVPAAVLPYPLPAPSGLHGTDVAISVGDVLDAEALGRQFVRLGYRRVELVEEAGEFAVRGGVIDVGTPAALVRAVLDVTQVESLAEFDAATQRSTRPLTRLAVPPLRLFADDDGVRSRLAELLLGAGCEQAAEAALDGHSPHLWEGFLGWAADHVSVAGLLPRALVCEPAAVVAEVERKFAALAHARDALARDQAVLPEPGTWLQPPDAWRPRLAGLDTVHELIVEDGRPWVRFETRPTPALATRPLALLEELRRGVAEGQTLAVVVASPGEAQRFVHLLAEAELPTAAGWAPPPATGLVEGTMARGFTWPVLGVTVYGRADVTHLPPPRASGRSLATVLAAMRDLKPGDFVVHAEHGIGRFLGFRTLGLDGAEHECVELEYAGGGKLLVPLERADVLEKYAGSEGPPPRIDRLGGASWARTTSRVKRALRDMADELLKLQAQRESASGYAFAKDSPWQREFEGAFEYELTADQAQAIREVKRDMESPRPMDRLLVGDVGYGKTEVAMRAVFKAVMDGKQVAVLAPTTILAEQHDRTFASRFAGFPVEIRWLSRFVKGEAQRRVLAGLADGTVDVVIATHRLLGADVAFRDLGLLVVDEEQRFGVAQKERLKRLRATVDVLALSATPIPRTLNQGLVGLRDVSIIETPPRDRLAVQTHVLPFRTEVIREAIRTEMARGGQSFFVHNRVQSIGTIAELLAEAVPEARVVVAHGQMDERRLESAMEAFLDGRADVLLATSIVENGLDIPNANTLIVNRADRFGLAQLYQLRGRVGRADRLAFAYLLVPSEQTLGEEARQRLAAILEFADLGAGFRIAARDLEIRGAGNLLGAEQHGHLRSVGYETYCRLLEEAVQELRGEAPEPRAAACEVRLGLDLRLPDSWIGEENLRLVVYRRVAAATGGDELDAVRAELVDRFGSPPPQLDNLLLHSQLRHRASSLGISRIRRLPTAVELGFDPSHPGSHAAAVGLATRAEGVRVDPSGTLRIPTALPPQDLARALLELLAVA